MSAKNGRFEGQITFASNQTFTAVDSVAGSRTVTVDAGSYYHTDLCATVQTETSTGGSSWTITPSNGESGTGRVEIFESSGSFSVTWVSTDLRDALGFTANIVAETSAQTGAAHAKGLWLPGVPKWSPHGDEDGGGDIGVLVTDKTQTMSGYGHVKTLMSTERREIRGIKWQGVLQSRARTRYETYANESFEQFWRDTQNGNTVSYFVAGSPVRFYPDADADATYSTVKIVGLNEFDPQTLVPNWVGRYVVEIPLMVKVPA